MRFIIEVELELPADDEGLTDEGWEIATSISDGIEEFAVNYSFKEILHVSQPKRKVQS